MWVEKYRPETLLDIEGNDHAKQTFIAWLKNKTRRKKAVLLYGPPGVGKTALVHTAANENDLQVIEMNASDTRTGKAIDKIANPATTLTSLDKFFTQKKGSLLFLDEVDGIFGREDRGGIPTLTKIIQESQIPVVLAANSIELRKLRPLTKNCVTIRFRKIRIPIIIGLLQKICTQELKKAEFEVLEKIAINSQGDYKESKELLDTTVQVRPRDISLGIHETLKSLFTTSSTKEALEIMRQTNVDYDSLLLSIQDNLPLKIGAGTSLSVAYDLLSRADVVRGRIGVENWKLLKYFFLFLAQAVTVPTDTSKSFDMIFPPIRILTLFWTKNRRVMLNNICSKIGAKCHLSRKKAKQRMLPFITAIIKKEKPSRISTWLQFDNKELQYLESIDLF